MKRTISLTIILIVIVSVSTGFIFSKFVSKNMNVRMHAKDLPEHGLVIIKPTDPDFDTTASGLLEGMSVTDIEEVKPLSVIIRNTGNKTVVAHSIVWEGVEANGKKNSYKILYANAEALTEESMQNSADNAASEIIRPGTARLFTLLPNYYQSSNGGSGRSPREDYQAAQSRSDSENDRLQSRRSFVATALNKYTDITVYVDGVFFDDGSFVGEDTTGFFDTMSAQVNAKRDLMDDISDQFERGKSKDDIFSELETRVSLTDSRVINLAANRSPEAHYDFFRKLYAKQLLGLKKVYGDEKLIAMARDKKGRKILKRIR